MTDMTISSAITNRAAPRLMMTTIMAMRDRHITSRAWSITNLMIGPIINLVTGTILDPITGPITGLMIIPTTGPMGGRIMGMETTIMVGGHTSRTTEGVAMVMAAIGNIAITEAMAAAIPAEIAVTAVSTLMVAIIALGALAAISVGIRA